MVGIAKSGMEASRLLAQRGDTVFVTEIKDDETTAMGIDALIKEGVLRDGDFEIGRHTEKFIEHSDLMVVSPGVKVDALPVKWAEKRRIPIISELELGYSMCPCPIIAVTGTSGKTTTATLIGRVLRDAGFDAVVCGNIGNPFTGELKHIKKSSIVILEVSSFQLEWIDAFKPKISIILNISANHLDRYRDMDEYVTAKSKIFINQDKGDIVFLNGKDPAVKNLAQKVKSAVEFFDEYMDFEKRYNVHNEDFLAVMSVCHAIGVSEDSILNVIRNFKGIEHHLEHVAHIKGVEFVNDSKATTVSSVEWALESLEGHIILIMGGRYKGGDFGLLKDLVEKKVDLVIAIGEARPQIRQGLSSAKEIFEAQSLDEAVEVGFKRARKGGAVLLSPGCSSFDMFKSYEERGKIFKDIVQRLR